MFSEYFFSFLNFLFRDFECFERLASIRSKQKNWDFLGVAFAIVRAASDTLRLPSLSSAQRPIRSGGVCDFAHASFAAAFCVDCQKKVGVWREP